MAPRSLRSISATKLSLVLFNFLRIAERGGESLDKRKDKMSFFTRLIREGTTTRRREIK